MPVAAEIAAASPKGESDLDGLAKLFCNTVPKREMFPGRGTVSGAVRA
jgi:hypothetical protein